MGVSKIKQSLLDQLKSKGADTAHFRSLVDDYCWMDAEVKKMKRSIREDGPTITTTSAAGKEYQKENPAIKNIVLYNRQMLAILREMELSTKNVVTDDDDEL
ncbi:MAG: P27 family phage terminase small subunit [Lachnospiraceae bacterium]|nr:P27 family phage terminase small subunit [Lachnospiraceae bacterium]